MMKQGPHPRRTDRVLGCGQSCAARRGGGQQEGVGGQPGEGPFQGAAQLPPQGGAVAGAVQAAQHGAAEVVQRDRLVAEVRGPRVVGRLEARQRAGHGAVPRSRRIATPKACRPVAGS